MGNSDLGDVFLLDATGQADLVRKGEVASIELVEAAIARIERLNPALNAVVTPMYDLARRSAPFWCANAGTRRAARPQLRPPEPHRRRCGISSTASMMRISSRAQNARPEKIAEKATQRLLKPRLWHRLAGLLGFGAAG